MNQLKFQVRKNETETELVDAVSETYKDHFLFINYKGNLAIGSIKTGLMIVDKNIITGKYGQTSFENWKLQVDFVIELIGKNYENTTPYIDCNHSCHVFGVPFAPDGKIQDVINKYHL